MKGKTFQEIQPGEQDSLTMVIGDQQICQFAAITGDVNPIHLDEEFARQSQFGVRIAHGMLVAGLISAVLGTRLPGPGAIYLSQNLKFVSPVAVGEEVTAVVEVMEKIEGKNRIKFKTTCTKNGGIPVIVGEALMLVPNQ